MAARPNRAFAVTSEQGRSHAQVLLGLLVGHILRPLFLHVGDALLQSHQLVCRVLLGRGACLWGDMGMGRTGWVKGWASAAMVAQGWLGRAAGTQQRSAAEQQLQSSSGISGNAEMTSLIKHACQQNAVAHFHLILTCLWPAGRRASVCRRQTQPAPLLPPQRE